MNDQVKMARFGLDDGMPLGELIRNLNENPLSYLKEHCFPKKAFLSLQEGEADEITSPTAVKNPIAPPIKGRHLRLWTPEEG
jgi:hypothetical protein